MCATFSAARSPSLRIQPRAQNYFGHATRGCKPRPSPWQNLRGCVEVVVFTGMFSASVASTPINSEHKWQIWRSPWQNLRGCADTPPHTTRSTTPTPPDQSGEAALAKSENIPVKVRVFTSTLMDWKMRYSPWRNLQGCADTPPHTTRSPTPALPPPDRVPETPARCAPVLWVERSGFRVDGVWCRD